MEGRFSLRCWLCTSDGANQPLPLVLSPPTLWRTGLTGDPPHSCTCQAVAGAVGSALSPSVSLGNRLRVEAASLPISPPPAPGCCLVPAAEGDTGVPHGGGRAPQGSDSNGHLVPHPPRSVDPRPHGPVAPWVGRREGRRGPRNPQPQPVSGCWAKGSFPGLIKGRRASLGPTLTQEACMSHCC